MRVLVTGASGLVGRRLAAALASRGDEVVGLTRSPRPACPELRWVVGDPAEPASWGAELEGTTAVVNLAGETIAQRWTRASRARIFASRVRATEALVHAIDTAKARPEVLVSASAVGFYGTDPSSSPEKSFEETEPQGRGFLADLALEWEKAAVTAEALGVRVIRPRLGMVLASEGGALPRFLASARRGLGSTLGTGEQWVSWIAADDLTALLLWALDTRSVRGAVNAVAPNPVRQCELMETLGRVLGRRIRLRAPAPLLRLALGAMADELILGGQKVSAGRAQAQGFEFQFPELEPALRAILERSP